MEISKLLLLLCSVFIYAPLRAQLIKVEAGAALSTQALTGYYVNRKTFAKKKISFPASGKM
ncbi:hypothetical protein CLV51_106144 [Chitinophaga niastensis]|uniref:Uncharacterized protein n=1 Tax=Chitinophaga niastensis TaxID=536980 RepID=A0A2P8HDJ6_CHINA|nr:hypothetical protein [Chitinophaga niastensis]PSL44278.1 hypothetical protein CLV51_106144 [Chitinophaga niastensis]